MVLEEERTPEERSRASERRQSARACCITLLVVAAVLGGIVWKFQRDWNRYARSGAGQVYAIGLERACVDFEEQAHHPPLPSDGRDLDVDTALGSRLIAVLAGKDAELSISPAPAKGAAVSEKINFLEEMKPAKRDESSSAWMGGLAIEPLPAGTAGAERCGVYDPWGNPYRVRLEGGGDRQIENPDPRELGKRKMLRGRLIVWGAGPDGDFDTWEDNTKSWE